MRASFRFTQALQVGGGSEFMDEFEDMHVKDIPLYVLPPATPRYNRRELYRYVEKYNAYRPYYYLIRYDSYGVY
jgi:hypothetical protein